MPPSSRLLPALLLAASLGCGGGNAGPSDPNDPGTTEPSQYALQVGSTTLVGNSGVDTRWDAEQGTLYLGADDVAEPLGTVTLSLGPISSGTNGSRRAIIDYAVVSTTRIRVGTSDQLDAKLYNLAPVGIAEITGIKTGTDYIEGTLVIDLIQVLPAPTNGGSPVPATLTGTFRAVND